jgi:flagellar hook-basal body complex protein FliE
MAAPIPINPAAGVPPTPALPTSPSSDAGDVPFADLVSSLMQETSNQQAAVGESVRQLVTGESDSIHDVVLTASKADLAFRLVMEIRNRLMSSFEDIMRMQI